MNVRKKLNALYVAGAVLLAAFCGAAYNSWWVFGVVLTLLLVLNIHTGNIRPAATRSAPSRMIGRR